MKTNQTHHRIRPGPVHRHPSLATLLGLELAASVCGRMQADVISDFEGELRLAWNVQRADVDVQVVDGELNFVLPPGMWGVALDYRTYEIPETEPLTFSVDLVSNVSFWSAGLGARFADTSEYHTWGEGQYGLYRLDDDYLVLTKGVGNTTWLFRVWVGPQTGPETLSLNMRREGDNLRLTGTVARRDSGEVIQRQEFLDRPAVDATFQGADPGAPYLGRMSVISVGGEAPTGVGAVLAFDNWRCSQDPAPLAMTARRAAANTMAVEWEADALLLQAGSLTGTWVPYAAEIVASPVGYSAQMALDDTYRFFRLGPGAHWEIDFATGNAWSVGKATPDSSGGNLSFRSSSGHGSALGMNLGDVDFVMRYGVQGLWWGDCVASVDIVDWEATMAEGSAFGIVLRANPEDWTWFADVDGLPDRHYLGRLTFRQPGNPGESLLSLTGPGREVLQETSLPAVDPAQDYRLRFWAVGDKLTLELFDLEDPETPISVGSAIDARSPRGMEALYVTPTPVGVTAIQVDNFFVRGVHAAAQW
ncbi:MAG: hypothetical protein H7A45_13145 [Verrucomicrobiales bacterium]|nr:hypothetical protein [Verrucomicrobiales bacterium]